MREYVQIHADPSFAPNESLGILSRAFDNTIKGDTWLFFDNNRTREYLLYLLFGIFHFQLSFHYK